MKLIDLGNAKIETKAKGAFTQQDPAPPRPFNYNPI